MTNDQSKAGGVQQRSASADDTHEVSYYAWRRRIAPQEGSGFVRPWAAAERA